MQLIINDIVVNHYLIPFKITPEQIEETITHETVKKVMDYSGYTVILFLKKFDSHYILVDGRWDSSTSSLEISSAFIFNEELIKNIPIDNPLAVLERLANEFGAEIKISDKKGKFIHYATIEASIENVRSGDDAAKIVRTNTLLTDNGSPGPAGYLADMVLRPQVLGSKLCIELSLVYYINTEKYTRYLKSNNII